MKTFKQMFDEEMMTTGDAGIPQDTKDAMPKKKRKRNMQKQVDRDEDLAKQLTAQNKTGRRRTRRNP